jgi:hypothetical protein
MADQLSSAREAEKRWLPSELSVESQPVKRKLEGWCAIPASLGYYLPVEFCMGGCEDRTRVREGEESPLLEAGARELLMKTYQAGNRLNGCCGDL